MRAVQTTALRAEPLETLGEADLIDGQLGWSILPITISWGMFGSELRVGIPVSVEVVNNGPAGPVRVATIVVMLRLDYEADPSVDADDDGLDSYAGISGLLHSWGYVRAEIQHLSTKIGFPALLLPPVLSGHASNLVAKVQRLDAPTKEGASMTEGRSFKQPRRAAAGKKVGARKRATKAT